MTTNHNLRGRRPGVGHSAGVCREQLAYFMAFETLAADGEDLQAKQSVDGLVPAAILHD